MTMIATALEAFLAITGAALMLIAAIGIIRMPDLFTRMQATTKAASLGAGLLLLSASVHFGDVSVTARALAAIAFVMLTQPIGAHLIGRAAYFLDVPQWDQSVIDELRGRYDEATHGLEAPSRDGGEAVVVAGPEEGR